MAKKRSKEIPGDLLVHSLTELRDGLRGDAGKLTVKTIDIPEPPRFSAAKVHKLRDRLGFSQRMFAKLLGVSSKLIEAWEAGTRTPSPMACRLLDAISRNPAFFVHPQRKAA